MSIPNFQGSTTVELSEQQELVAPLHPVARDNLLLDMSRRLGKVEANTSRLVETSDDHEERLRKVEKRQWSVPGVSMLVAILAALGLHPHP